MTSTVFLAQLLPECFSSKMQERTFYATVCFYNLRAQCFAAHTLLRDVEPGVWIRKLCSRRLSTLRLVENKWQSRAVFQACSPVQNKCSTSFVASCSEVVSKGSVYSFFFCLDAVRVLLRSTVLLCPPAAVGVNMLVGDL